MSLRRREVGISPAEGIQPAQTEDRKMNRKKIDSPASASRARVVCSGHTQTGININTCFSDHARTRARRRPFTKAEVAAWREQVFADGIEDPVKVAVQEAVRDFGHEADFTIWPGTPTGSGSTAFWSCTSSRGR